MDAIDRKTVAGKTYNENKSNARSYRLIHDGIKVIAFFESEGFTATNHTLYVGNLGECVSEIAKLKFKPQEPILMDSIRQTPSAPVR